jgi:uncharacterized protein YjeT (DUF2065 family)
MDTTIFFERGFGIVYFILGASLLLRPRLWLKYLHDIVKTKQTMTIAIVTVATGVAMITGHNTWSWEPSTITTAFGWIALFKGLLLLFYPRAVVRFLRRLSPTKELLRAEGSFAMMLASLIIYYSL